MCLEMQVLWDLNYEKIVQALELFFENGFVGKEWVLIKKVSKEERQEYLFWGADFFFLRGKS